MSVFLLASLFVVTLLLLIRVSERGLGLVVSIMAIILASVAAWLGSPERAHAALAVAGVLLGSSLLSPGMLRARPRHNIRPLRRQQNFGMRLSQTSTEKSGVAFADYEVLDRVGIGGMGSVYRAKRRSDGRVLALKVPQEKYLADAKFLKRFFREAEVLRRLAHPNIVRVFDYKAEGDEHYIAMEYLEGESLERILETRGLNFEESVQILRAVADALRHIHAQNIVHRDIKPANVMVLRGAFQDGRLREGGVKLMDFGIAVGKVLTRLTMTGARVGTPIYMAPEQAKGNRVDARSDVYSLGLLLYEMVTGDTPFKGSYEAVVHQQVFEAPRPPKQLRMDVPTKLNDLILHMIEKDPASRPTLDEVVQAVDADLLQEDPFDDPQALVVSVSERQGAVRLLDLGGRLRRSLRDLSGDEGLPAAPTALAPAPDHRVFAAIVAYRAGMEVPNMIHVLDVDGRTERSFGRYGLSEGELLQPVSLSYEGGRLYVLDAETCYVSIYSDEGEYVGRFGGRGDGRGSFEQPQVVVASPDGDVYVLDSGNRQVQRFSREGRYLSRLAFKIERQNEELRPLDGLAVDAGGNVYVADAQAMKVRCIGVDGKPGAVFVLPPVEGEPQNVPWLMAADADGTLFCVRQGSTSLRRFTPDGQPHSVTDTYSPVLALALLNQQRVLVR